ncbi:hypothetical protein SASPL_121071 [Salvia splendens]|uniref:Uncharacterized protein n=1 Tax=Salvia splendens TaxID=180675 RepID=A0A8X8XVF0_SALSN|nr:hypothetical protein SASPL_121071 [Salvia splendens]
MGDEKSLSVMGGGRDRDRELLIPVADSVDRRLDYDGPSPASASSSHHHSGREKACIAIEIIRWRGATLVSLQPTPHPISKSKLIMICACKEILLLKLCINENIILHLCNNADILQSCEELGFEEVHDWMNCCSSAHMLYAPALSFCSVILLPIAITFYVTWWFIHFVDGFFSPIYAQLGIDIFGLGFVTSITFIFLVGVFMSSWLGASVLSLGEWFIKRMPFIRHIYNASKQISAAISPDQNTRAFKEVAIIRHPRIGEYAFGFITSSLTLQVCHVCHFLAYYYLALGFISLDLVLSSYSGDEELCCVYVPTNHLYIGDIFLVNAKDIIRPNLSVREGIEIVVSGGMSMPQILSTLDPRTTQLDRIRPV